MAGIKGRSGRPIEADSLTERIIRLRHSGLKWREVAAELGCSENTAKVSYHRRRYGKYGFSAADPTLQPMPLQKKPRKLEARA
jgi:hypothetical protein